MAPATAKINDMLNSLDEEDYNTAISFIEFLAASRKKKRAEESKKQLAKMQALTSNNKPWHTEAEMLAELANFRRERTGL